MYTPAGGRSRPLGAAFRPVTLRRPAQTSSGWLSILVDLACFTIPFFSFFYVSLIGVMLGTEVVTLALVGPCLLIAKKRIWRGYNKTIFLLMGIWLISQVVTDLYRHSPFANTAKGLAAIGFFAIDLIVISALLYKNPRRIVIFTIGKIIGLAILRILDPTDPIIAWKFGYSPYVIPAVVLLSCYFYRQRQYLATYVLVGGLAGYNLLQNFRSQFLILTIVGIIIFPFSSWSRQPSGIPSLRRYRGMGGSAAVAKRKPQLRPFILIAVILVVGAGSAKTYSYLASRGSLGDDAQEKYEAQARGKFGVLAGGRPESMISWKAVVDSPILGHGSWAEDPKYAEMLTDIQLDAGYADDERPANGPIEETSYLIPAHSHLMQAWVWAGFLGAVFWFYVLYLTGKALFALSGNLPPLAPYFAYLVLAQFWNVLFSPFGLGARLDQALVLVVICTILEVTPKPTETRLPASTRMPRYGYL